MSTYSWSEATLNTLDLWLDSLNPRIHVGQDASQEEIRLQLIKYEQIIELANEIIKTGRLLPGERIITYFEDGKHIVLEGNRRVCACQLLLDPTLIPPEFKKRFPKADSEMLILNISQIKTDVAPNRNAAEPILTKRHTFPGILKWSPIANMRRVVRWFEQGVTIDEISVKLNANKPRLLKLIRDYYLYKIAIELPDWSQEEIDILKNDKLKVNPYTRFFTLSNVKEVLCLEFDDKEYPFSRLEEDVFKKAIKCIAKSFLIPESTTGKPWANTRTSPEDIFNHCEEIYSLILKPAVNGEGNQSVLSSNEDYKGSCSSDNSANNDTSGENKEKDSNDKNAEEKGDNKDKDKDKKEKSEQRMPKPARFFEDLKCFVEDQRLIQLSIEIKMINHTRITIAATMLTRALLESSLRYQIIKANKWDDLIGNTKGRDPNLEYIINYCINKENKVFKNKRASDALKAFKSSGFKDAFDFVVHGVWAEPDPKTLEQAASILRPLINYILTNERWSE